MNNNNSKPITITIMMMLTIKITIFIFIVIIITVIIITHIFIILFLSAWFRSFCLFDNLYFHLHLTDCTFIRPYKGTFQWNYFWLQVLLPSPPFLFPNSPFFSLLPFLLFASSIHYVFLLPLLLLTFPLTLPLFLLFSFLLPLSSPFPVFFPFSSSPPVTPLASYLLLPSDMVSR